MFTLRKSRIEDLDRIAEIFASARQRMKENGNPDQWKDDRPSLDLVREDIRKGNSYVVEDDGRVVATFAYIIGIEPTYLDIDGQWLSDDPYGTIHRIASDGSVRGIFELVLNFAESFGRDIRIDTHEDNTVMRHLLAKHGFIYCGIIIVDNGTKRLAFQKELNNG